MTIRLLTQVASGSAFMVMAFYIFSLMPKNLHGPDIERKQLRAVLLQIVLIPLFFLFTKLPHSLATKFLPIMAILLLPLYYVALTGLRFGANTLPCLWPFRGRGAQVIGFLGTVLILAIALLLIFGGLA
jgi:hypothetical protein